MGFFFPKNAMENCSGGISARAKTAYFFALAFFVFFAFFAFFAFLAIVSSSFAGAAALEGPAAPHTISG
jgi:hypothetical protein